MSIDLIVYDDTVYIQRLSKIKTAFKKGKTTELFPRHIFLHISRRVKWKLNYTFLHTGKKTSMPLTQNVYDSALAFKQFG